MKHLLTLLSIPLIMGLNSCNEYKVGKNTVWIDEGALSPVNIIKEDSTMRDSAFIYWMKPFENKLKSVKIKTRDKNGSWVLQKELFEGQEFEKEKLRLDDYLVKIDSIKYMQKMVREK